MAAVIATLIHSGDVGPSFATHESLAYAHSTNISGGGRSRLPDFIFIQSTYFLEGSRHSVNDGPVHIYRAQVNYRIR